jgi:hypothetical protein
MGATGKFFKDGAGRPIGGGFLRKKKERDDKRGADVNIAVIPISAQAAKSDSENASFFGRTSSAFGRPVGKDRTSPAASRAIGDMSARPASEASRKKMLENAARKAKKKNK